MSNSAAHVASKIVTVTNSKPRPPVPQEKTVLELDAYSIAEFCARHDISRATYYVLKKRGLQPDEIHLLDRIIISKEAAAKWRRQRTADTRRRLRGNS